MQKIVFVGILISFLISAELRADVALKYKLRYAHMNSSESVTGIQAELFAKLVSERTKGIVEIQVFPSSLLGDLWEMVDQVRDGTVALHHNTMAGIGSIFEPISVLDTPYIYRDVDHLMKVVDVENSSVMKRLNERIIKEQGVRILYNFYFGTRHLTCDRAIYTPTDLKDLKIRAIPFPIYLAAVKALGATATPIDWSEVKEALSKGVVNGQENPVDVIVNNRLFDYQSHLMLTGHILAAESVVINEQIWQQFSNRVKFIIKEVAKEVSVYATNLTLDREQKNLETIREAGMEIIGQKQGLDKNAFRSRTRKILSKQLDKKALRILDEIKSIK